jgi:hypothetical protein
MSVNIIGIIPAAHLTNANLTLQAMGLGAGNITKKSTSVTGTILFEEPATHFYMSFQGAESELLDQLLGSTTGDLPPLPEGVMWGEEGVIEAADAATAMAAMAIASFNNGYSPTNQVNLSLAAHNPVLQRVPDEEV